MKITNKAILSALSLSLLSTAVYSSAVVEADSVTQTSNVNQLLLNTPDLDSLSNVISTKTAVISTKTAEQSQDKEQIIKIANANQSFLDTPDLDSLVKVISTKTEEQSQDEEQIIKRTKQSQNEEQIIKTLEALQKNLALNDFEKIITAEQSQDEEQIIKTAEQSQDEKKIIQRTKQSQNEEQIIKTLEALQKNLALNDFEKIIFEKEFLVDEDLELSGTLLFKACFDGYNKLAKHLMQLNSSKAITMQTNKQKKQTPLYAAARNGHLSIVSDILGCDEGKAILNIANENDVTPLSVSASFGHKDIVELLLRHKANPNTRQKNNGASPLHFVIHYGSHAQTPEEISNYISTFEMLIDVPGINLHITDKQHYNPLYYIAKHNAVKMQVLLIEKMKKLAGKKFLSYINYQPPTGYTALMNASFYGNKDCVEHLLQNGAYIHLKDKYERNAIFYARKDLDKNSAIKVGKEDTIQLLLKASGSAMNGTDLISSLMEKTDFMCYSPLDIKEVLGTLYALINLSDTPGNKQRLKTLEDTLGVSKTTLTNHAKLVNDTEAAAEKEKKEKEKSESEKRITVKIKSIFYCSTSFHYFTSKELNEKYGPLFEKEYRVDLTFLHLDQNGTHLPTIEIEYNSSFNHSWKYSPSESITAFKIGNEERNVKSFRYNYYTNDQRLMHYMKQGDATFLSVPFKDTLGHPYAAVFRYNSENHTDVSFLRTQECADLHKTNKQLVSVTIPYSLTKDHDIDLKPILNPVVNSVYETQPEFPFFPTNEKVETKISQKIKMARVDNKGAYVETLAESNVFNFNSTPTSEDYPTFNINSPYSFAIYDASANEILFAEKIKSFDHLVE